MLVMKKLLLVVFYLRGGKMAVKRLKDKVINVRATDISKLILEGLAQELGVSQADVVEMALKLLNEKIKNDKK